MKVITIIFFCFFTAKSMGQTKIYNTRIENARDIKTVINIDTQTVINYIYPNLGKLYLMGVRNLTNYKISPDIKLYSDTSIMEMTLLNPDSTETRDIFIKVNFSKPVYNAYFKTDVKGFGLFNPKVVRDTDSKLSDDRKEIYFKATYLGVGVKLLFTYLQPGSQGNKITFTGVGKLF